MYQAFPSYVCTTLHKFVSQWNIASLFLNPSLVLSSVFHPFERGQKNKYLELNANGRQGERQSETRYPRGSLFVFKRDILVELGKVRIVISLLINALLQLEGIVYC